MMRARTAVIVGTFCAAVTGTIALISTVGSAFAHCDTMSGPVIPEARAALDQSDVTPVLKWIKPEYEAELRAAFASAVQVRSKGPEAKTLADKYFFETLIRLHRAGEGVPYTGLKDTPPEEIVVLADEALSSGSADEIIKGLQDHLAAAIKKKFNAALQASTSTNESVTAGREFVEAYVQYMHYVEGTHAAIMSAGTHDSETPEGGQEHAKPGEHEH